MSPGSREVGRRQVGVWEVGILPSGWDTARVRPKVEVCLEGRCPEDAGGPRTWLFLWRRCRALGVFLAKGDMAHVTCRRCCRCWAEHRPWDLAVAVIW